jgi:hypothetical protein
MVDLLVLTDKKDKALQDISTRQCYMEDFASFEQESRRRSTRDLNSPILSGKLASSEQQQRVSLFGRLVGFEQE